MPCLDCSAPRKLIPYTQPGMPVLSEEELVGLTKYKVCPAMSTAASLWRRQL